MLPRGSIEHLGAFSQPHDDPSVSSFIGINRVGEKDGRYMLMGK